MKKIKNLSNTSWQIFNNPGVMGTGVNIFKVTFSSNENLYTQIKFIDEGNNGKLFYGDTQVATYPEGIWADEEFQKIAIDGGEDAASPMLISWLNQYARYETVEAQTQDIVTAINSVADAIREGGGAGGNAFLEVELTYSAQYEDVDFWDSSSATVLKRIRIEDQSVPVEEVLDWLDNNGTVKYIVRQSEDDEEYFGNLEGNYLAHQDPFLTDLQNGEGKIYIDMENSLIVFLPSILEWGGPYDASLAHTWTFRCRRQDTFVAAADALVILQEGSNIVPGYTIKCIVDGIYYTMSLSPSVAVENAQTPQFLYLYPDVPVYTFNDLGPVPVFQGYWDQENSPHSRWDFWCAPNVIFGGITPTLTEHQFEFTPLSQYSSFTTSSDIFDFLSENPFENIVLAGPTDGAPAINNIRFFYKYEHSASNIIFNSGEDYITLSGGIAN